MISDEQGAGDNVMETEIKDFEKVGPNGEGNKNEELDELENLIKQANNKYQNKLKIRFYPLKCAEKTVCF